MQASIESERLQDNEAQEKSNERARFFSSVGPAKSDCLAVERRRCSDFFDAASKGAAMAKFGWFRKLWLTQFSQPATERTIYQQLLRSKPKRVMELGLGTLGRTERLLALAGALQTDGPLHYVGLDRFEGRLPTDPAGTSLKQAHQRLHKLASVQLVPGNIDASLSRLCNHLGTFDLLLISASNDERHLERSWFFIQRIVSAQTTILVELPASGSQPGAWKSIDKARVNELASRTLLKRAG